MLSDDQCDSVFAAPCLPLRFLVQSEWRTRKPTGMEAFSESACFHRMHDLFWPLGDAEAVALLTAEERAALDDFEAVYSLLPWRVIATHPHISELLDDDLAPLIAPGRRLYRLLSARVAARRRTKWLRRVLNLLRNPRKA